MPLPHTSFEHALQREMLAGERVRMTAFAIFFSLAALGTFVINRVLPQFSLFPDEIAGLLLGGALYEFIARQMVGRALRLGWNVPEAARYANAFLETSVPTAIILLIVRLGANPVEALSGPPLSLYTLFIVFSTLRLSFKLSLFTGLVAAAEYLIVAFMLLAVSPTNTSAFFASPLLYVIRSVALLVSGLAAGLAAEQIRRQFTRSVETLTEKEKIVDLFGQHVSPAVVDKLLSQPVEVSGEVRYVCVMFLDLRNFTAFANQKRPEEVVAYLNTLFSFMIDSVNAHQGIINKFLGDGFMAVFGAPLPTGDERRHAVNAALEILEKVRQSADSGLIPPTRIGVGLHAGEVVTGTVGSRTRKEYTIIGDVVNLAARLEQLNKTFNTQVLISEAVQSGLGDNPPPMDKLGPVEVRGLAQPIPVFKLA